MQTKSLSMRKAISAALFVLLLSVVGMKNALAQTQVATLQHADSISGVYYGANAFVSAHEAAVAGDIITLSSGTFNRVEYMHKTVTIRGAGCVFDTLTQVTPTIISGNITCRSNNIRFEGINFIGTFDSYGYHNLCFTKCVINKISIGYAASNRNWQFVNCIIKEFSSCYRLNAYYYSFIGTSIINSVVRFTEYNHVDITMPNIINNSVILFDNNRPINNIIAYNSIIATVSDHTVSNCTFVNCIGIKTGETSLFAGQTTQNVMTVNSYEDVFETFAGTVTYDNIYQLNEEVSNSFLGNDGTEVGIYGGIIPYKTRPSYMILKNCNVAGQTDENKKLNVEMELIGPED